MKTIDDFNFRGLKALIRVDYNVPLDDKYQITDTTRIDATVPTINKILNEGGSVILMSHLGRPKEGFEEKFSLKHLIGYLSEKLGLKVAFATDCIGKPALDAVAELKPGGILLLENLRFHKEEEKGGESFAKELASLGDVYVNDAFGTAHRPHASTAIIAKFFPGKKMFGYLMGKEVESINYVLKSAKRPFTAILGGAKVSGKIEIINHLIDKVDNMIIGGGMAYTFIKALGGHIGKSLCEDELLDLAANTVEGSKMMGVNFHLPADTVIADRFDNAAQQSLCNIYEIPDEMMGMDIGRETIGKFEEVIAKSATILWNGPMGVFEMPSFEAGTKAIALAVAAASEKGAYSLIGGGDSVAAINKYHLADKVSYVSTGGGAMLECIEGNILPGIQAIEQ
ncbi:MAG: phosphoglycerate kinase [Bacteroidetes bacterium]|nr:phosphoglycerate kinase [Bacteroidota bacterium]